MPLVNGELMSPDDAMAKGLCPECAAPLDEKSAQAHMDAHYATLAHGREPNLEANRRGELVRAHFSKKEQAKV